MRPASATSVLLILTLATSASACVTGWGFQPATSCQRPTTRKPCSHKEPGTKAARGPACGRVLKSLTGQCSLRSLAKFQFAGLHRFELSTPLRRAAGKITPPFNSATTVSSIGSPETDRGPPCS
jgi:hypothetical protein